jgi:uncharacterized protein
MFMAIMKAFAVYFIFISVSHFGNTVEAEETNTRPLEIEARFISMERNRLASPLKGLSAQVGKFSVDGLIQYALLLQPENGMPESGWPVIIFNHGFHPEPSMSGRRTIDGISDRPGDYYRQIPQILARQGFLIVAPDYRGHNDSIGTEFTLQENSSNWYVRDVLGMLTSLQGNSHANMEHLFMLGHSMGAEVTLLAAAALGGRLKGASIWSAHVPAVNASQLEQIYSPINIHHAKDDPTTVFEGSVAIASQLDQLGNTSKLYSYLSANHLFTGDNLQLAITRDIEFFRHIMLTHGTRQE